MKKYCIFVLTLVLALSLSACRSKSNNPTQPSTTTPATTTQPMTTAPILDPTIMDPTIDQNIPDPEVNPNSTMDTTDMTGASGNGTMG